MRSLRKVIKGVILGASALLAAGGIADGQTKVEPSAPSVSSARDRWEQRVLQRGQPRQALPQKVSPQQRGTTRWSPERPQPARAPVQTASNVIESGGLAHSIPIFEEMQIVPEGGDLNPIPVENEYYGAGPGGACEQGCDPYCSTGCDACGDCYCDYSCVPGCGLWGVWTCAKRLLHQASLFGGVHGFKGPADLGRNGNFGFHEGINWGGPLGGPFGWGYQVGFQAAHSNFSGDQTTSTLRSADRNQVFFTAGIFRRELCHGLQWGVAYDALHDEYFDEADLQQIRTETALVLDGLREVGFWGAFGVSGADFLDQRLQEPLSLQPADTYSLFYRRRFSGGGQGRIWAGFSGGGDALLGGDCTIPLGTSWALENNFAYLIPKEGTATGGQIDETWSVSIQLVWYPGRQARSVLSNPFHPLFGVADNSQFLLDRK